MSKAFCHQGDARMSAAWFNHSLPFTLFPCICGSQSIILSFTPGLKSHHISPIMFPSPTAMFLACSAFIPRISRSPFPHLLLRPWFVNDFTAARLSVGADCGWLSRISIWCQRHLTRTHVRAPAVSAQIPCDVRHRDDVKDRFHAWEWQRERARPLQKGAGLVWNIDVLRDLRGAVREIRKSLAPVAMFTFCCGVAWFWFKAVSENKQKYDNPSEGWSLAASSTSSSEDLSWNNRSLNRNWQRWGITRNTVSGPDRVPGQIWNGAVKFSWEERWGSSRIIAC